MNNYTWCISCSTSKSPTSFGDARTASGKPICLTCAFKQKNNTQKKRTATGRLTERTVNFFGNTF